MKPRPIMWTCPECSERVPVGAHIATRSAGPHALAVKVVPDLADAWLHVWSHTESGGTSPASESEG